MDEFTLVYHLKIMQRYLKKERIIDEKEAVNSIKQWAYPLQSKADLQPLMDRIGDARIVMLGEASHLDATNALHPLHIQPDGKQMPETFPFGV